MQNKLEIGTLGWLTISQSPLLGKLLFQEDQAFLYTLKCMHGLNQV